MAALRHLIIVCSIATACDDSPGKLGIGSTCDDSDECASGLCLARRCLDPLADDDGDGVRNDREGELGLDPFDLDTDDDGTLDGDESFVNPTTTAPDASGDATSEPSDTSSSTRDAVTLTTQPNDEVSAGRQLVQIRVTPSEATACPQSAAQFTATAVYDEAPLEEDVTTAADWFFGNGTKEVRLDEGQVANIGDGDVGVNPDTSFWTDSDHGIEARFAGQLGSGLVHLRHTCP